MLSGKVSVGGVVQRGRYQSETRRRRETVLAGQVCRPEKQRGGPSVKRFGAHPPKYAECVGGREGAGDPIRKRFSPQRVSLLRKRGLERSTKTKLLLKIEKNDQKDERKGGRNGGKNREGPCYLDIIANTTQKYRRDDIKKTCKKDYTLTVKCST